VIADVASYTGAVKLADADAVAAAVVAAADPVNTPEAKRPLAVAVTGAVVIAAVPV
jgi:hypothetical protein